jgi:GDP-L-fucose synthase
MRIENQHGKVLITGGSGLVGKYLKKILPDAIYVSSKDYDLTTEDGVKLMFLQNKPDVVVHLAARVGGIIDNINHPAEYFTQNVMMNTLMVEYSRRFNVKKFIGILSTCIYPDVARKYPMDETMLHEGPPTITNFSYGYSKRSMGAQIDAYNLQYKLNYQYLIPCNLYGIEDKDDENKSHFIASLIKKINYAKNNNSDNITLFGNGTPLRQFMYAGDFAEIIKQTIQKDIIESFNVATEENLSIKQMAEIALNVTDSENIKIEWDTTKPNGQFRKDVSIDKFKNLFPNFEFTPLSEGIKLVYNSYYDKVS